MATGEKELTMTEVLDDTDAVPEQALTQDHCSSQTPFFPAAVLVSAPSAHTTLYMPKRCIPYSAVLRKGVSLTVQLSIDLGWVCGYRSAWNMPCK